MKYYLNTETLRSFDLVRIVKAAKQVGFDGLEIWTDNIITNTKELIQDHNLEVISVIGLKGWFELDGGLMGVKDDEVMDECYRRIEQAALIGAKYIVAVPSRSDRGYFASWDDGHSRLQLLTNCAKQFNIKIAFEFIGGSNQINTVKKCDLFLENQDAVMVLDSYHFWRGNSEISDLDKVKSKVELLHISNPDPNIRREIHKDRNRIMPEKGIITEIIQRLDYNGPVCLGVYNPIYWSGDEVTILEDGIKKSRQACGEN